MSGLEIERKFLVKKGHDFKSCAFEHYTIKQAYMPCLTATVRVRQKGNKAFLTIKSRSTNDGLSRYEFEKEISIEEANNLFKLCSKQQINKTRYLVKSGNHTFEIDEFHGNNEGLVIAEVELNSPDEEFIKPNFIDKEVTGQKQYYNSFLAQNEL